jgi:hypothetical protein
MDSPKKDGADQNTDKNKEPTQPVSCDPEWDDEWDEWYDDNEFQNKNSKIRRSKKRLYKQRDEW